MGILKDLTYIPFGRWNLPIFIGLLGALLVFIGALGPWFTEAYGGVKGTISGYDLPPGLFILLLDLIVVLSLLIERRFIAVIDNTLLLLPSSVLMLLSVGYQVSTASKYSIRGYNLEYGWGLYLSATGGVFILISCLLLIGTMKKVTDKLGKIPRFTQEQKPESNVEVSSTTETKKGEQLETPVPTVETTQVTPLSETTQPQTDISSGVEQFDLQSLEGQKLTQWLSRVDINGNVFEKCIKCGVYGYIKVEGKLFKCPKCGKEYGVF